DCTIAPNLRSRPWMISILFAYSAGIRRKRPVGEIHPAVAISAKRSPADLRMGIFVVALVGIALGGDDRDVTETKISVMRNYVFYSSVQLRPSRTRSAS